MNERLRKSIVRKNAAIEDAMRSLEASGTQIVLVVDEAERLVGTLTDGDLRRALLQGNSLDSPALPHVQQAAFTVSPTAGRADVIEMMRARLISQVPVVDAESRVVGLHLLHEAVAVVERNNWAVVMAGGKGTRLGDLTKKVPKPMLLVAGRPILERIVLHLVGCGIRRVFLSVNYLADVIEDHFGDGRRLGCDIQYLRESEPLGTAGSLSLLPERPDSPIFMMNGDVLTQTNIGAIIDFHERRTHSVTVAVRKHYQTIPYGCVEVDDEQVVRFREKPTSSHLINAGMYVLDPDVVGLVQPNEELSAPAVIDRVLAGGGSVAACEIDEDWIDVGHRQDLSRARGGV